ncbi:MAG: 4-alpha-glucanotransferase [Propionibacteriaceae bacterium]|jgi:4-alpha-glucanotransferase|nr:4-alpha-glucanotransferase [Propionibacteriaceae bacterium]
MAVNENPDLQSEQECRQNLVSRLSPIGVSAGYVNTNGAYVVTGTKTLALVAEAFTQRGVSGDNPEVLICTPGRYHPGLFGTIVKESGRSCRAAGYINEAGYHTLYLDGGGRRFVIAAPEQLPTPKRGWGWQVQLYSARSSYSWGIGDFQDLATICRLAAEQGASCVQVSPVHATAPISKPQDSPYSPASREFLNLLHVAIGLVPGAEMVDLSDLAAQGRALNQERLINRTAVWRLKLAALERIWQMVRDDLPLEYQLWRDKRGLQLSRFSIWCAIAEQCDTPKWRSWPHELRRPDSDMVRDFAMHNAGRVEFYSWCQWVASQQFYGACHAGAAVIADVAVGFDANSEDAWNYQDAVCFDFEIGAPPDDHNIEGQRWGLPPLLPTRLIEGDFRVFINMVRATLAHASALRLDHVMQLWRLYWVPKNLPATEGVYIYYPVDALLAILRVEAARQGAWIVGEDMGTVAAGVRETMAVIGLLGNRSAMRTPVAEFPELGVGTSSTHDQVTVAGLITGSDVDDLNRIGKGADFVQIANTRRGLAELANLDPEKPAADITTADIHAAVIARYRLLSSAPSRIVLVTLEDAAMVRERPNMPGTTDIYPNWCLAIPNRLDDVMRSPLTRDLISLMTETR